MGTYATDTSVTPEASRAEIERTLQRFGARYVLDLPGSLTAPENPGALSCP